MENKTVVVIGYGMTEVNRPWNEKTKEFNKVIIGKDYGIHKDGCRDIKKTMQKYYNSSYASFLNSGLKNKSGKVFNGHFHSLQDALEKLYTEPMNENEVLDGIDDEHINTTDENIEIFNCAK